MRYVVYDVFTTTAFGGNPLAVVFDGDALSAAQMQQISREFNYSETTFVLPPDDPSHTAKVRIFTPSMEIPFAGHPTIGTARALHDLGQAEGDMVLELGVGPIPVSASGSEARFVTRTPLKTWPGPAPQIIAASIGQEVQSIRTDRHAPEIASVGLPFALAELTSLEALQAARPDIETFRAFDPYWPADTHYDLFVYVRRDKRIDARMFAPLDGIPEDPATGSAAAALAAYLGKLDGTSQSFEISQGVTMGRPSTIQAEVTVEDGAPSAVAISGTAVKVMEGQITL